MRRDPRRALTLTLLTAALATARPARAQGGLPDPEAEAESDEHRGGAEPHGAGQPDGPPPDGAVADPSLPHGSIDVALLDPEGKPLPGIDVTMGVLVSSVANGDRRNRTNAVTDAQGRARFDKLETGLGVAYRVSVVKDGATFAVAPFNMPPSSGMRAQLHVYPVVTDVEKALVVAQGMLFTEVKDDRVQIQQAFRIYNFGKTAWVPQDYVLPLPTEFTAFSSQQGMSDITTSAVAKKGVALRGTFTPGQHVVEFRWQLPYAADAEVHIEAGLLPHVAAMQVVAPASRDMILEAAGFPAPQAQIDGQGQRVLVTGKQLGREEAPLRTVSVTLRGLPTEGPGKLVATLLAAGGIAAGLVLGTRRPDPRNRKAERQRLLNALAGLEQAHREGAVGPKTYERGRRELLDELARTFAGESDAPANDPPKKARKAKAPPSPSS
jgi:hypothetical protein